MATNSKPTMKQAVEDFCKKQPLMTSMVYSLKLVEADYVPTMGTDGEHLFWNPKFLETLTREQAAAVIYHEVLHCAFLHMTRRKDKDHTKYNIAADYAINPIVVETFPLPKGALLKRKYYNMSAEQIYDLLPDPPKQKKSGKKKQGKGSGSGSQQQSQGGGGQSDKKDQKDKNQKGSGSGNEQDKEQKWGDHSMWGAEGEKKKEEIKKKQGLLDKMKGKKAPPKRTKSDSELEREWKNMFDDALVNNYGQLPGSLKRLVEKTHFIPHVDWRAIVQSILTEDESDYTFARPDRRFLGTDIIMPGLETNEKLQDVIFAYDTSASITEKQLRAFYNETIALFDQFRNVRGWVAVCDADLHNFVEIDGQEEFEDIDFQGGGGTAFEPVFRKIEEEMLNPRAVFYFTDTEGSFPEEQDYPVFWLVPSEIQRRDWHHQPSVPFGTVIEFMVK